MTRAPVRRWLGFWLGLPGMVFLTFLWADSASKGRSVRYLDHARIYRLEQKGSALELASYHYLKPGVDHGGPQFQFFTEPVASSAMTLAFPAPRMSETNSPVLHLKIWSLPHWFLTVGYLALWLGLLFRRGRRMSEPAEAVA